MLGLEPVSLVVNKSVSRGCRIARCCNIASDMLSVLVEQEVEMLSWRLKVDRESLLDLRWFGSLGEHSKRMD